MRQKRILVLYTGGTFGMDTNLKVPNLSAKALKTRLIKGVPEMPKLADCSVEVMFNIDSCQMNLAHWFKLAERIQKAQNTYEGAVILHGTDTLAYTASALSMLLGPTPFPVVLTGAQKPLATLRNDARTNLISALEVATHAPISLRNRVLVVFHDEVFLGSRVRKKSAQGFAAFESPRFPVLATIGSEVTYHEVVKHLPKLKSTRSLFSHLKNNLTHSPSILPVQMMPNFPSHLFGEELFSSLHGILLTLYTSGTAPTSDPEFIEFLKKAKKTHTPIFAITEREDTPTRLSTYAAGRILEENGVLWCADLTPEAAYVKAAFLALSHKHASKKDFLKNIKGVWSRPITDECNTKKW